MPVVAVLVTWRLYRAHLGPNDGINHHLGRFWFLVVPGCSRGRPRIYVVVMVMEKREDAGGRVEVVVVVANGLNGNVSKKFH